MWQKRTREFWINFIGQFWRLFILNLASNFRLQNTYNLLLTDGRSGISCDIMSFTLRINKTYAQRDFWYTLYTQTSRWLVDNSISWLGLTRCPSGPYKWSSEDAPTRTPVANHLIIPVIAIARQRSTIDIPAIVTAELSPKDKTPLGIKDQSIFS